MALVGNMPNVYGEFGAEEERLRPIAVGMNAKCDMDEDEFDAYLLNLPIPLYPDVEDVEWKRVSLKVDSGPGRVRV